MLKLEYDKIIEKANNSKLNDEEKEELFKYIKTHEDFFPSLAKYSEEVLEGLKLI